MAGVPYDFTLPLAFLLRPQDPNRSHKAPMLPSLPQCHHRLRIVDLRHWNIGGSRLRKIWRSTPWRRPWLSPSRRSTALSEIALRDYGTSKGLSPALDLYLCRFANLIIIVLSYAKNVLQLDDPDSVWIDLRRGILAAEHKCMAFLDDRVEQAMRTVPDLRSGEHKEIRTIKSVRTVMALWEALVLEADARILHPKRREAPAQDHIWVLRVSRKQDIGPVGQITRVGCFAVAIYIYFTTKLSNTRNSG
jgi:hypothetical protein